MLPNKITKNQKPIRSLSHPSGCPNIGVYRLLKNKIVHFIINNSKKIIIGTIITIFSGYLADTWPHILKFFTGSYPEPKIIYFKADPDFLKTGMSTRLSWKTEYSKKCLLQWYDPTLKELEKGPDDWMDVQVIRNIVYRLIAISYDDRKTSAEIEIRLEKMQNNKSASFDDVPFQLIIDKFDCNGKLTNEQKGLEFAKIINKKVKIKKTILKVDVKKYEVFLSPEKESFLGSGHNGIEIIVMNKSFSSPLKLHIGKVDVFERIREGEKAFFSCLLLDYCHDGYLDFADGELTFYECELFEQK